MTIPRSAIWVLAVSTLFIFPEIIIKAQENNVVFEHLSASQGLSHNSVSAIIQDKDGYMWFGTENGLNRYDGYDFKIFTAEPKNQNSLSNNSITCLYEDKKGGLWIGTTNGLNRYNKNKEDFYTFLKNEQSSSRLGCNWINTIFEDRSGTFWIGTRGQGLVRMDRERGKFFSFIHQKSNPHSIPNNSVNAIIQDYSHILWIGTSKGIAKYNPYTGKFIDFNRNALPLPVREGIITTLFVDRFNNIWIGTLNNGVYKYDPFQDIITTFQIVGEKDQVISNNRIVDIQEDREHHIWLGTRFGGLNEYDPSTGKVKIYQNNPQDNHSLSDNNIFSLYESSTGILWVGTKVAGVNKYNQQIKRFTRLRHNNNYDKSLIDNMVNGFCQDKNGDIWIATQNGLSLMNGRDQKASFINYLQNGTKQNVVVNNAFTCIVESKHGAGNLLWMGNEGGGISCFDPKEKTFRYYDRKSDSVKNYKNHCVRSIIEDSQGLIWLRFDDCSGESLDIFDPQTGEFYSDTYKKSDLPFVNQNVTCLFKDRTNIFWIGIKGKGLICLANGNSSNFTSAKSLKLIDYSLYNKFLSVNDIYIIHEDKGSNLWIGTGGGGLFRLEKKTGRFTSFNKKNGLPSNVIYGILDDAEGNLWISTDKGLARFNPRTLSVKVYDSRDGLQDNIFNRGSCLKTDDGYLLFGGIEGFNILKPVQIWNNAFIPPLVFTRFTVINKPVGIDEKFHNRIILKEALNATREIVLHYNENIFTIEFAALDYTIPEKNSYSYKLEGFDKEWNCTTSSRRYVTYNNLLPGRYLFKVRGSNNDGIWNYKGNEIRIIILPPFWKTLWFRLIGLLFVFSLIWTYMNVREKWLKKEKKALEVKVKARTREIQLQKEELQFQKEKIEEKRDELKKSNNTKDKLISIIAHDLKNPFNAIIGLSELLSFNYEDLENGKRLELVKYINISSKNAYSLLENLLQWARTQNNKIFFSPVKFDLTEVIIENVKLLSLSAERKQIAILSQIPPETYVYADRNMLSTIVRNLLSNAIKFTCTRGEINISSTLTNHFVIIEVSDNGIGMSSEQMERLFCPDEFVSTTGTEGESGSGLGLIVTKEFVEKNGGRLEVHSQPGKGSTFSFSIPV